MVNTGVASRSFFSGTQATHNEADYYNHFHNSFFFMLVLLIHPLPVWREDSFLVRRLIHNVHIFLLRFVPGMGLSCLLFCITCTYRVKDNRCRHSVCRECSFLWAYLFSLSREAPFRMYQYRSARSILRCRTHVFLHSVRLRILA